MAEKYLIYFQPGQIIFHVTGGFDGDPTALLGWAKDVTEKKGKSVTISAPQVHRFSTTQSPDSPKASVRTSKAYIPPRTTEQRWKWPDLTSLFRTAPRAKTPPPFSLVAANITSPNWPQFKAYKPFEDQEAQEAQQRALLEQLDLIKLLDDERKSAPPSLKLEVVSPNWLLSSNPSGSGTTGGPGGPPSAADAIDIGKHHFNITSVFTPNAVSGAKPEEPENVVVAILDTSYTIQELDDFGSRLTDHELVQKLLGPSGALRGAEMQWNVTLDSRVANAVPDLTIDGHDYDMTDHGLFVAGIVNSLAPQAKLHLYQVLNKYGVGDVLSIVRALEDVRVKFGDRLENVVINMSLTMTVPLEENPCHRGDKMASKILSYKPKPAWFWKLLHGLCQLLQLFFPRLRCRWSWFDRQAMVLESISDLLYVLGPSMIAAAGNNAANGYRPPASYPAAFDSVLGVGAWSRGVAGNPNAPLVPASYSNLADTPTIQGVLAVGGEAGKKNGLLGVYLGNIPDGTPNGKPNPTGWARWSGTSFATPIVSGLVALWVSNKAAANTREAINVLLDLAKKETGTSAGESPIPVEQEK